MIRLIVSVVVLIMLSACHHGTKPQDCAPHVVKEAQVIMTFQENQSSMATLDLADFAYRH